MLSAFRESFGSRASFLEKPDEGLDCVVTAIEAVLNPPLAEDLHKKLQAAEESLHEYRCPYCRSPLTTRATVQSSEDEDGLHEDFECGYANVDGYMTHPCPSDPKFPKLDDYTFSYEELREDSYWKALLCFG